MLQHLLGSIVLKASQVMPCYSIIATISQM